MTQRRLDLVLLAGIGVILLVILGLALSPAPTGVGDISDPARIPQTKLSDGQSTAAASAAGDEADSEEAEAAPAETSVERGSNVGSAAVVGSPLAAENTAAENTAAENATESQARAMRGETPAQTSADAATRPAEVPTAGIPVERVGFAYATGSEGACGVPLTAWNYVAVSRDLLEAYPCGTAVTLTLADDVAGRSSVTAQVGDTMGADITDTVNVFVGQDEPALEYGVTRGTLAQ